MLIDLTHIHRLTNTVGIIQHARYSVPNYHHGYCLDDNARALIIAAMVFQLEPSLATRDLLTTYMAYIQYMQRDDGKFRNFLSFDHRFLDDGGSEDSYGRAMWALGVCIKTLPDDRITPLAKELFLKALPHCKELRSVRAVAYCLTGLIQYFEAQPEDQEILPYVYLLREYLEDEYKRCATTTWPWYEEIISYDNAIIPYCLLRSARLVHNKYQISDVAEKSAQFLDSLLFENSYLSTIGNNGWYAKSGSRSFFGQQPIEVPSIILLYKQLYSLTSEEKYKDRMTQAFQWFFGENALGLPLYDQDTKGCCDGLDQWGVNQNQGAESTISFWQAHLYLFHAFD